MSLFDAEEIFLAKLKAQQEKYNKNAMPAKAPREKDAKEEANKFYKLEDLLPMATNEKYLH